LTQRIEIIAGESRCTLAPELGGSILSWAVEGQPMLRSASEPEIASGERLGLASFPLVPWSNRIAGGRFAWGGCVVAITPNFAPESHAIHGIGWNDVWAVEAQSKSSVTLTLQHPGDARWPWAFLARQSVSVEVDRLTVAMSARNLSSESVPLGFGHHPYFDREGASLWFTAKRVWMNDEDMLPTQSEIAFRDGTALRVSPGTADPLDFPLRLTCLPPWSICRRGATVSASSPCPTAIMRSTAPMLIRQCP
jgi:aldose 1-epimerase